MSFALHGAVERAFSLFNEMIAFNVIPDKITFSCLLSSSGHVGLVDRALQVYHSMEVLYKTTPNLLHQGCVVDALARCGLLQTAREFIDYEVLSPDLILWRSLLAGCRTFHDTAQAEYAAKKALRLDPLCDSVYLMVANVYGLAGMPSKQKTALDALQELGISKIPGLSEVHIGGAWHTFAVQDLPAAKEIPHTNIKDITPYKNGLMWQKVLELLATK